MKVFGIDISTWQRGYPYDKANSEGVKFAILRAGFAQTKDNQFETHYANAKRLGWGVGAYWYMYATTVEGAKKEARAFLKAIAGKQFDYPVYLDIEDGSISRNTTKETRDAMVRAFGEIIESAGYYFGVYCNLNWYRNIISGAELNKKYDWWIACWSKGAPSGLNYGLWQFGGETNYIRGNKVAGVTTDQNYAVKDYPTIIKNAGLNGYPKQSNPEPTPAPKPSIPYEGVSDEELARRVWLGEFGNGNERKAKLGSRYAAVQALVDRGVGKPQSQAQYYTIQRGDTLYGIALKFGTTIGQLVKWNNIKNANLIYAGTKIRVK
jgi:LysM repeat protein